MEFRRRVFTEGPANFSEQEQYEEEGQNDSEEEEQPIDMNAMQNHQEIYFLDGEGQEKSGVKAELEDQ